jgi:hypothetical protein
VCICNFWSLIASTGAVVLKRINPAQATHQLRVCQQLELAKCP